MVSISKQTLSLYRQCANCIGYTLAILGLVRTDHTISFEWDGLGYPISFRSLSPINAERSLVNPACKNSLASPPHYPYQSEASIICIGIIITIDVDNNRIIIDTILIDWSSVSALVLDRFYFKLHVVRAVGSSESDIDPPSARSFCLSQAWTRTKEKCFNFDSTHSLSFNSPGAHLPSIQ